MGDTEPKGDAVPWQLLTDEQIAGIRTVLEAARPGIELTLRWDGSIAECGAGPAPTFDDVELFQRAPTLLRELLLDREILIKRVQTLEGRRYDGFGSSCPCVYTTPCHERCTCVNPLSSSGCRRCCSYGSDDQRRAMAERITNSSASAAELEKAKAEAQRWRIDTGLLVNEMHEQKDGESVVECVLRTIATLRKFNVERADAVRALEQQIKTLRTCLIHACSLQHDRFYNGFELLAIRDAANLAGEPFTHELVQKKYEELVQSQASRKLVDIMELLTDIKSYLERQYVRSETSLCLWQDVINPALKDRINAAITAEARDV